MASAVLDETAVGSALTGVNSQRLSHPTQATSRHVRSTLLLFSRIYPKVRVNAKILGFFPPDDTPWVEAELLSMIYDAAEVYRRHARLWFPSKGKAGRIDALDWATDILGGSACGEPLPGRRLLLVYELGSQCTLTLTDLVFVNFTSRYPRSILCWSEVGPRSGVKEELQRARK